ncbi:hypothetical protein EYZ11_003217 [Aspergillus tanneri]|nr:hypothetical protein EYZ11_003217 [Aspergillus tanneri]
MQQHDPSHNPAHVHRVVSLARTILLGEQRLHHHSDTNILYDASVVDLAGLLHDIGDRKYLSQVEEIVLRFQKDNYQDEDQDQDQGQDKKEGRRVQPDEMVLQVMISHGADRQLAEKVQTIVSHVSYTKERADPAAVRWLIENGYPELAIVQDADRLDAIGAVGIGRCFTFLGAQGKTFVPEGGEWEMENAIEHFQEKLEKLEGMMKTQTGREMARVRTKRLLEFRSWWEDEMAIAK